MPENLMETFKWAPGVVKELCPSNQEPTMETFDWGMSLAIAWILPSGRRAAIRLQSISAVGGEWRCGEWVIEPDSYVVQTTTRTGLKNAVLKSIERDKGNG